MGHLDDAMDWKDWLTLGAMTLGLLVAYAVILSAGGCIAVMADKVEMKDPKQPYAAAAPIPDTAANPGRFDPTECEKER